MCQAYKKGEITKHKSYSYWSGGTPTLLFQLMHRKQLLTQNEPNVGPISTADKSQQVLCIVADGTVVRT